MAVATRIDSARPGEKVTSEILDRLPPQSLEAERGVLGSILLDPSMGDEVALLLRPDDFYADAHRRLYAQMQAMHDAGKRIDTTLLMESLKQAGELESIGGAAYLAEVVHAVPVAAHAVYYAQIVREKSLLRTLIHTTTAILRDAYDPTLEPREQVNQAEERIFAITDERTSDSVVSMHDLLLQAFEHIDRRMQGGATGIPTGFTELDNLTGGLHESELAILAARPSMGKTALAINIADHVAVKSEATTLFVSLEMSRLELAQRLLCARGSIDGHKFRSGFLSAADREKLVEVSNRLSKAPLYVDDTPTRTVTEIAACARRLKRREGLRLIVIDYLQLIEPDNPRDPRQEQVAKIARQLKHLARKLQVPVLCLAQLNRHADAAETKPKLSQLRESGAIEQDADVVMFIYREECGMTREEAQERQVVGKAEIIIAKQRNGPQGNINLHFRPEYTRFEQLSTRTHDEFEGYGSAEGDL